MGQIAGLGAFLLLKLSIFAILVIVEKLPCNAYNICKKTTFNIVQITAKRFNNESEKPDTSCFQCSIDRILQ